MSEQSQPTQPQQPNFKWLRAFAVIAGLNICGLSWFKPDTPDVFIWVLLGVVLMWGLGANAREAIIDILKTRAGK